VAEDFEEQLSLYIDCHRSTIFPCAAAAAGKEIARIRHQ
jgi:hypothetical protein